MSKKEIQELIELRFDGSAMKLAVALDVSFSAVDRWLREDRTPKGPASILMRQWLEEARKQPARAS